MNRVKRRLRAETLVIATGDRPQYLGIPGEREYCITRSASTKILGSFSTCALVKTTDKIETDFVGHQS